MGLLLKFFLNIHLSWLLHSEAVDDYSARYLPSRIGEPTPKNLSLEDCSQTASGLCLVKCIFFIQPAIKRSAILDDFEVKEIVLSW